MHIRLRHIEFTKYEQQPSRSTNPSVTTFPTYITIYCTFYILSVTASRRPPTDGRTVPITHILVGVLIQYGRKVCFGGINCCYLQSTRRETLKCRTKTLFTKDEDKYVLVHYDMKCGEWKYTSTHSECRYRGAENVLKQT